MTEKISKAFLLIFLLLSLSTYILHGYFMVGRYFPHFDIPDAPSSEGSTSIGLDFTWAWFGTKNALDHDSLYETKRIKAANHTANQYNLPPLVAVLYAPFGHVDSDAGYKIYICIVLLAWLTIVFCLSKLFRLQYIDYIILISIFFLSCPYRFDLQRGNSHAITFCLILLGITALFRYRAVAAGALFLSVASFIKVSPIIIPFFLLCMGEIGFFFWFCGISGLLFFLSGGLPVYEAFCLMMTKYNFGLIQEASIIPSTVSTILMISGDLPIEIASGLAHVVNFCLIALTAALAYRYRGSAPIEKKLGVVGLGLIVSRVVPSLSFIYALTYLPFIYLVGRDLLASKAREQKVLLFSFLILLSITLQTPLGWLTPMGRFNVLSQLTILPFLQQLWFPLMALFGILVYLVRTSPSTQSSWGREDQWKIRLESFAVFLFCYLCINSYLIGDLIP